MKRLLLPLLCLNSFGFQNYHPLLLVSSFRTAAVGRNHHQCYPSSSSQISTRRLLRLYPTNEECLSSSSSSSSVVQDKNRFGLVRADVVHPSWSASKNRVVAAAAAWLSASILFGAIMFGPVASCYADEYGKEVEAPTLFTGENVEICTKRGPLGACLETTVRTAENDNDKAKQYFRDPSDLIKEKEMVMRGTSEDGESNALIQQLKQRSEDNREKNRLYVERKTFENDQSATFGPFDRQVLIMNTDGKTFTLLQNPQAMRLKKAGFIGPNREFLQQPTQEELDAALNEDSDDGGGGLAGALLGVFGGGNSEE